MAVFFFFQAEDGIRDLTVTGVQTCALPISKGLAFSAVTTTRLTARRPGASWARFSLFSELDVDSVHEGRGRAVSIYRTKKSSDLWVRFDPAPRPGDTVALRVAYHGDLMGYTSIVEEITRQWPGWLKVQTATALDQWLFVQVVLQLVPAIRGTGCGRGRDVPHPKEVSVREHRPSARFASGRR